MFTGMNRSVIERVSELEKPFALTEKADVNERLIIRRPAALFFLLPFCLLLPGCIGAPKIPFLGNSPSASSQLDGAAPSGDWAVPPLTQRVLLPGATLRIRGEDGRSLKVEAGEGVERTFTWAGASRRVFTRPRSSQWYGSRGLSFTADRPIWKPHDEVDRLAYEEGFQSFNSLDDARLWLEGKRPMLRWRPDGLAAGWRTDPISRRLIVTVWQVFVGGDYPQGLAGKDAADLFLRTPSQPSTSGGLTAGEDEELSPPLPRMDLETIAELPE